MLICFTMESNHFWDAALEEFFLLKSLRRKGFFFLLTYVRALCFCINMYFLHRQRFLLSWGRYWRVQNQPCLRKQQCLNHWVSTAPPVYKSDRKQCLVLYEVPHAWESCWSSSELLWQRTIHKNVGCDLHFPFLFPLFIYLAGLM